MINSNNNVVRQIILFPHKPSLAVGGSSTLFIFFFLHFHYFLSEIHTKKKTYWPLLLLVALLVIQAMMPLALLATWATLLAHAQPGTNQHPSSLSSMQQCLLCACFYVTIYMAWKSHFLETCTNQDSQCRQTKQADQKLPKTPQKKKKKRCVYEHSLAWWPSS